MYYHTNVDIIKTYKLRIYDMFHVCGSRVGLTRCGIQKNYSGVLSVRLLDPISFGV